MGKYDPARRDYVLAAELAKQAAEEEAQEKALRERRWKESELQDLERRAVAGGEPAKIAAIAKVAADARRGGRVDDDVTPRLELLRSRFGPEAVVLTRRELRHIGGLISSFDRAGFAGDAASAPAARFQSAWMVLIQQATRDGRIGVDDDMGALFRDSVPEWAYGTVQHDKSVQWIPGADATQARMWAAFADAWRTALEEVAAGRPVPGGLAASLNWPVWSGNLAPAGYGPWIRKISDVTRTVAAERIAEARRVADREIAARDPRAYGLATNDGDHPVV